MICVSFGAIKFPQLIDQLKGEKLAEIRIDLNNFSDDELSMIFSSPACTIATCRPGTFTDEERIQKLKFCIESGAAYVDLELDSDDKTTKEISDLCDKFDCSMIISYHDHERTPASSELRRKYKLCAKKGADIVKIACNIISDSDNARIMSLYDMDVYSEGTGLVSIGMGEKGKITRIAAPLLGAPFTYASADNGIRTADGQINGAVLRNIYKLIKDDK